MKPLSQQFPTIFDLAVQMCAVVEADAILLMLEGTVDWAALKERLGTAKLIVAADLAEEVAGADEAGLATLVLGMEN